MGDPDYNKETEKWETSENVFLPHKNFTRSANQYLNHFINMFGGDAASQKRLMEAKTKIFEYYARRLRGGIDHPDERHHVIDWIKSLEKWSGLKTHTEHFYSFLFTHVCELMKNLKLDDEKKPWHRR